MFVILSTINLPLVGGKVNVFIFLSYHCDAGQLPVQPPRHNDDVDDTHRLSIYGKLNDLLIGADNLQVHRERFDP